MEIEYCNFRILVQGRLDRIPAKLRKLLKKVQEKTKHKEKTIIIAIDYSGRREIMRACEKIVANKESFTMDSIQQKLQENLYVTGIPDPDLIIRTGGEKRVSDFLLWQLCNTELYFTDVYWPDFDIFEFRKAMDDFHSRQRRFGSVVN
jgi:undecaprenyl diphosphate synthase